MGLYSDQMATRIELDMDAFDESMVRLASVVMGGNNRDLDFFDDTIASKNAIDEILKYFHIKPIDIPNDIEALPELLEYLMRPHGIMRRNVSLSEGWYKDGVGPMLGKTKDGSAVALIPGITSGYTYFDYGKGKRIKLTKNNYRQLDTLAIYFYHPLPTKKISVGDLIGYMLRSPAPADYLAVILTALLASLVGMAIPYATHLLFDNVLKLEKASLLFSVAVLMTGATISAALISLTRELFAEKISTKIEVYVQSAAMSRLLSLPASFFGKFTSGEISERLNGLSLLSKILTIAVFGAGLTSLFSLIYIVQVASFAPAIAMPALMIASLNLGFIIFSSIIAIKNTKAQMESQAKVSGLVFSLFSGIQKIKLAGGERRAFAKWAGLYTKNARVTYAPPWIIRLVPVISTAITLLGAIILFHGAAQAKLSVAQYMAFNASFSMISAAIVSLSTVTAAFSQIKPILDMVSPLLETEPELAANKKIISHLSGAIELNNISFRYSQDMPWVLDNLSLRINPGQHVAVVGASGCGKSTLIRLLLGFEQPEKGAVYYDGQDLSMLDLKSLRRLIGCVIQNGTLMSGTIFHNIVLSAPHLTLKEAWRAAELAGIAEDIRRMPMGMHTFLSEGSGGISGGQKQRLLIARAVASNPKIIMLDEATSALDNLTQKQVSDALNRLNCTRIVIAHRLSTIRQCSRILLLEDGKIVEDGTYDQLMKLNGKFAALVERQRLEGTP